MNNRKLYTNNYSGYKGIHWDKFRCKWYVRIYMNEQSYFMGRYTNFNDAVEAREKVESAISLMKGMDAKKIHISNAKNEKVLKGILSINEFNFKFEIQLDLGRISNHNAVGGEL